MPTVDSPETRKLGRYEILSELGRGAMGIVYKARDPRLDRYVVLKTLKRDAIPPHDLDEYLERFRREAHAAGVLSHPGIVGVHDIGEDPDTGEPYLALEYVAGTNLQVLINSGVPLPAEQVSELVADVADALQYAHDQGIVHRDIKPANLFLGDANRVKVGDFGIARVSASTLTATGQALGTPNYMSPEQLTGEALDGRSDLYSLGVVAYQLLTHESPFVGRDFNEVARKILDYTPPSVASRRPDVPAAVSDVIARAMAKDRAARYASGREMADAFRRTIKPRRASGATPRSSPSRSGTIPGPPPAPRDADTQPDGMTESTVAGPPGAAPAVAARRSSPASTTRGAEIPALSAPPATRSRAMLVAGIAGLAFVGTVTVGALLIGAWLLLVAPDPDVGGDGGTAAEPDRSLVTLLAEGRYEEVERLGLERLRIDPSDRQARTYVELARKALDGRRRAAAKPCDLQVELTSSFSGSISVSVDGSPAIEETFRADATILFGRVVPGTVRPAREHYATVVGSGPRRIEVAVRTKSGRTSHERAYDVTLPEGGTLTLHVAATTADLKVSAS